MKRQRSGAAEPKGAKSKEVGAGPEGVGPGAAEAAAGGAQAALEARSAVVLLVPEGEVGRLIGAKGAAIRGFRSESGAVEMKFQVTGVRLALLCLSSHPAHVCTLFYCGNLPRLGARV